MIDKNDEKQIEEIALKVIEKYNKSSAFTARKVSDHPTDAFATVNRRFVTLSSNIGARPRSSFASVGQHFFDTTSNIPMTFDGARWRNGVGSIVAGPRTG